MSDFSGMCGCGNPSGSAVKDCERCRLIDRVKKLERDAVPREKIKRHCLFLFEGAQKAMVENPGDPTNVDYQSGVKAAMLAVYWRLTDGDLVPSDIAFPEGSGTSDSESVASV